MFDRFPARKLLVASAMLALPVMAHAQTFTTTKYNIGGDGAFDYLNVDGMGRVFISRSSHVMAIDGATGKVLSDIQGMGRVHGIAFSPKDNHGFITAGGDSSVVMFDYTTFAVIKHIPTHTGGLDGIMYDDFNDHIVLTNHSRPIGTATFIDAKSGDVIGQAELEDNAPEGAASDGKGHLYVNNEGKNTIQVIDAKTMKVTASWPIEPCDGPTGIAYDRATDRIFSGCSKKSVVVNAKTGKVVAEIANGNGVDALGWDASQKMMYIPGGDGTVTVVHQDSPDKYTVVSTVTTMRGARTITVDPKTHTAYVFTPEYGPAPAPAAGTTPPTGRGGPRGPMIGAWMIAIKH